MILTVRSTFPQTHRYTSGDLAPIMSYGNPLGALCMVILITAGPTICCAADADVPRQAPTSSISTVLNDICRIRPGENFQFSPENTKAQKGRGGTAASNLGSGRKGRPCVTIEAGQMLVLADTTRTGTIHHIWFTDAAELPKGRVECEKVRLQIFYAGERTPSIDVPFRYFFGEFSNLTDADYNIYSLPIVIDNRGHTLYLPIPFAGGIRIVLVNNRDAPFKDLYYQIDGIWLDDLPKDTAFLQAQFRHSWPNRETEDHLLFEANGLGHFIGGFTCIQGLPRYWHGEGEVKMFIDGDNDLPTICGTGTEDYYGSAWGYRTPWSSPFLGLPSWKPQIQQAVAYRWHLPDPVNFRTAIRVTLQSIRHQQRLTETRNNTLSVQFAYMQKARTAPKSRD